MSTFNNFDILIIDSNGGCDVFVHHFDTVEGFTPNCSANHLLVLFNKYYFQAINIHNNLFFCKENELFSLLFQYIIF